MPRTGLGIDVSYHRFMFAPLIEDPILRLRYVLYEASGRRLEDIRYAYGENVCPVLERALSRQLHPSTSVLVLLWLRIR
jgi:hypothetical protein